jgi:phage baseplate assembly protein W
MLWAMTNYKRETAVSLPFALDAYGNIRKTYEQSKIWADRVRSVIGTLKTERPMNTLFGTNIPAQTFSTESEAKEVITREVRNAFDKYLPLLILDTVNLTFNDATGVITLDVIYDLPNQEKLTTSVGIAYISGNKLVSEDLL